MTHTYFHYRHRVLHFASRRCRAMKSSPADRLRFASQLQLWLEPVITFLTPRGDSISWIMNTRSVSVLGLGIGVSRSTAPLRPCARALVRRAPPPIPAKRYKSTTSFWATSYPPPVQEAASGKVPTPPPLPAPSAVTQAEETDGQRAQRQQRYLDSLMNKAGEVGLQCELGG